MLSCPDRAGGSGAIIKQMQRTEVYSFIIIWKIPIFFLSFSPQQRLWLETVLAAVSSPELHLLMGFCTQPLPLFHNWLVCSSSLALHPSSYFPSLIYSSCPLPSFLLLECEASLQKNRRSLWTFTIPPIFPLPSLLSSPPRWWDKYLLAFIFRLVKLAYSLLFLFHVMMWNEDNSTLFSAPQGWAQFEENISEAVVVFGALQNSGSHCCILPLYLFDKWLSHLLLLKIRKTKATSDPAIDEFGEVRGSKECSLSKGVVIHRYSQSLCGVFFCLLKRQWAKGISVCWNGTWFDQLPEQFPQLYGNRASLFFKNLKTPVGRWTLWELTSSLCRQIGRIRVPWACQSIFETMCQIRQIKENNKCSLF